jgi:hypothetical protein
VHVYICARTNFQTCSDFINGKPETMYEINKYILQASQSLSGNINEDGVAAPPNRRKVDGRTLLMMISSTFWIVKSITKVSHMKGNKQSMNDFGSNNLVPCVHDSLFECRYKMKEKPSLGAQLWRWPTPQV